MINNIRINTAPLLIGFIIFLFEYFIYAFADSKDLTNFYIAQVLSVWGYSFYLSYKKGGFLSIFSILLMTTFIFAFGGIFAYIITGIDTFRYAYTPLDVVFPEVVAQKSLCLYSIFICVLTISYFQIQKDFSNCIKLTTNEFYMRLGLISMLIFLPFAIWMSYIQFQLIGNNRGELFQAGSLETLGVPLYLRITSMLFTTGFYIVLASLPRKRVLYFSFALYFLTLIPILMTGERGDIVVPVLFFLWYMNRVYNIKIKFKYILTIGLCIIILSFTVSLIRLGDTVRGLSFADMVTGFFATSATAMELMQYYVMFKDSIMQHNYPFVLDSLIAGLTGAYGQNMETLSIRSSLGHQLVYSLNPNYYLSGFSTGTSFIAECYEFGVCGVAIGGLILSFLCKITETKLFNKHFLLIFLFLFTSTIILSPRGGAFVGIYDIVKYSFCFFLLKYSVGLFLKRP